MNSKMEMMLRNYEDAKANDAIEGLIMTEEEDALFMYMIDLGLDGDQRSEMIDTYLAGEVQIPGDYLKVAKSGNSQ